MYTKEPEAFSYDIMITRFDANMFLNGERKTLYVKVKLHVNKTEKYYPCAVTIDDKSIRSKLKDWLESHYTLTMYHGIMTISGELIDVKSEPITLVKKCIGLEMTVDDEDVLYDDMEAIYVLKQFHLESV